MKLAIVLLWLAGVSLVEGQKWGACMVNGGTPPAPVPIDPIAHNCSTAPACEGQADVIFVMDGSGSIGADYADAMVFLKALAMSFSMGDNLVRVGMVQYSGSTPMSGTCDSLNNNCDKSILDQFVVQELSGDPRQICATLDEPHISSGTPILEGLQVAHCAIRESSRSAKFMVFITDGQPQSGTETAIVELAQQIRNESITIFSIGVGGTAASPTADMNLLAQIASPPMSEHLYHAENFVEMLNGNFSKKFVDSLECIPPPPRHEPRCECWYKPDLLVCPLVQHALDYECGGGYGRFNYQCTQEQADEESQLYAIFNILAWVYKFCFIMALRIFLGCQTIDLGTTTFLCFQFVKNAHLMLLAANLSLILLTYLTRCFAPVWAVFFIIFLHIDAIACIADRYMNRKLKAPPPVAPPRSNLELFAYTNNKTGWKDKAYNTVELGRAKKTESKLAAGKKKYERAQKARKESIKKKGFSVKGAGLI